VENFQMRSSAAPPASAYTLMRPLPRLSATSIASSTRARSRSAHAEAVGHDVQHLAPHRSGRRRAGLVLAPGLLVRRRGGVVAVRRDLDLALGLHPGITADRQPLRDLLGTGIAGNSTGKVTTRRGSPSAASARSCAKMVSGVSWRTGCAVALSNSWPARANSSLRWSFSSVMVPTVERDERTGLVWSIAMAGGTPSTLSTAGLSMRSRNWRA
jgi:hypothetical protein